MVLLAKLILPTPAEAKILSHILRYPSQREHYMDGDYAMKMWKELKSYEDWQKEISKYTPYLDKWYETEYKANPQKAVEELKNAVDDERGIALKKGYDLAMLKDAFNYDYMDWFDRYSKGNLSSFFDEYQKLCVKDILNNFSLCGHIPDWRSPQDFAKEKKMIPEAQKIRADRFQRSEEEKAKFIEWLKAQK